MSSQPPPASDEQQAIIDSVTQGHHVLVDAVAGAGKTTTVLHIARRLQPLGGKVLALTYNAKLKSETRGTCRRMGITNAAIHTYHSAAFHLYGDEACATDEGIINLLKHPATLPTAWYRNTRYCVVVVDEAQDMTHTYLALTRKIICDLGLPDVQLVVLGDTRQAIYGFMKADARFLSMASQLSNYAPMCRSWKRHPLATTYRLPPCIAHFVNSQLLEGRQVLKSAHIVDRPAGCVRYLQCNTFGDLPLQEIKSWLASGLTASDIFILAPSIRNNNSKRMSPICCLENKLVKEGLLCYAASSDDDRLDEDVSRGKIVIATFHQVKGLERKAVLVFGCDASYHKYIERGPPSLGCPNAIYVAATRAKLYLTLLHDLKSAPLRTIRMGSIAQDCEYVGPKQKGGERSESNDMVATTKAVTDVLRHLSQDVMLAALACVSVTPLGDLQAHDFEQPTQKRAKSTSTLLKSKVKTGGESWENVSAITGTAMPCMFELKTSGKCTLLTRAAKISRSLPAPDCIRIKQLEACKDTSSLSTADFLFIANIHIALVEGYTHKLRQITVYDWLAESDVCAMMEVMKHHVQGPPASISYEVPAATDIFLPVAGRKIKLCGAVDCLDLSTNTAFEIKCVSHLSTEHFLQTALNGLLLERGSTGGPSSALSLTVSDSKYKSRYKHVLLNLCDGSAFEVDLGVGAEGAMKAAVILLEAKYLANKFIDDAAFLASTMIGPDFDNYESTA